MYAALTEHLALEAMKYRLLHDTLKLTSLYNHAYMPTCNDIQHTKYAVYVQYLYENTYHEATTVFNSRLPRNPATSDVEGFGGTPTKTTLASMTILDYIRA